MSAGEKTAWSVLKGLDPETVARESGALYDAASGIYTIRSFAWDMHVDPVNRKIYSDAPGSEVMLERLAEYSRLSILWYLTSARNIPLSGRLVRPENIKGGHLFSRGTHVLPLDKLARRYDGDIEGFHRRGLELNAGTPGYGDASLELLPLPGIPVTLILWRGDDEFPPRADFLFDASCEFQAPVDVLWSIAMMSVLIMM